jgi:hypothetical protein
LAPNIFGKIRETEGDQFGPFPICNESGNPVSDPEPKEAPNPISPVGPDEIVSFG